MRLVLLFANLILLGLMAGSVASAQQTAATKSRVAVFRLHGPVAETPVDSEMLFSSAQILPLKDLVARLNQAAKDDAVKAVLLLVEDASIGRAQTEEVRQAIAAVRAAGKDVYAHADALSMQDYSLLSGATRLSVVPTGDLWLTGLYGEAPYLRGLLDKLGVVPDFLHCGDYKSAGEMFMRDGPSPEADRMQNWLLDSMYETQVKLIADGRGVDSAKVKMWIDGGPYVARKAKELGLIDAVEHRQALLGLIQEKLGKEVLLDSKYGVKHGPEIDFSSPFGVMNFYAELLGGKKKKVYKDSVAIVYVDGPIVVGAAETSPLSMASGGMAASTTIRKALDKAADDDSIKAVVLRVNSPGGSATASEIILNATRHVKAKKPLVVSMGDVAGSGGYYVACTADTIFADESTITASIGVVGGKMATTALWNKVGVTWKSYRRGANAGLLSSEQAFTPDERKRMQAWMDEIYDVFKGHVVAIRGDRLKKPIDELAGGRVYTGRQALELGLVDKIGTLEDAIKFAAENAKISQYEVRVVPEPKNVIEALLEGLSGEESDGGSVALGASQFSAGHNSLLRLALPHLQGLDPERMRAVADALAGLEVLRTEGVALFMPTFVVHD